MTLTTAGETKLEHAINLAAQMTGPRVVGIDISGHGAILALVAASEPLQPAFAEIKTRARGIDATREIALQTAEACRMGLFDHATWAWIERPYGQPSAIDALARTTGAIAGALALRGPLGLQLANPSSNTWRRALGIKLGRGAKERAQEWAQHELMVADAHAFACVRSDHNHADAYGIARAALATNHEPGGPR